MTFYYCYNCEVEKLGTFHWSLAMKKLYLRKNIWFTLPSCQYCSSGSQKVVAVAVTSRLHFRTISSYCLEKNFRPEYA